jgi:hypothetical protein
VGDTTSNKPLKDGEAVTPSGELVTMGVGDDAELTRIVRNLLKWIKTKSKAEKMAMIQKAKKQLEQQHHKDI